MKILAIGGAGFIGGAYVKYAEKMGHECIIYDLPKDDILDRVALRLAVKKVDMVVHFAAMADVTVCIKRLDDTFNTNVVGTYNVGKVCAEEKKKLIYISTCCVYGNSLDDVETEDKTKPQCCEPYAVSKTAGEYILMGMPNLKYSTLRIGTVYGPGMREALFTYITLDAIKNGKKIFIDGDGSQDRQLIFIDDLINGIYLATEKFDNMLNGTIINLCGVEHTTALETIEVSEKVVGKKAITENREQRYGQTFHENISTVKAGGLLGWAPSISFFDGMKLTYETDPRFK